MGGASKWKTSSEPFDAYGQGGPVVKPPSMSQSDFNKWMGKAAVIAASILSLKQLAGAGMTGARFLTAGRSDVLLDRALTQLVRGMGPANFLKVFHWFA